MKILVTGGNGFIGQHLVKQLSKNHSVIIADLKEGVDLKNPSSILNLPDVDLVYHLATINHTDAFYDTPYTIIENSLLPLHNIIQRYKNIPIIYSSSSETYAGGVDLDIVPLPTNENVPLVVSDITNPRWSYGSSKIMGEAMLVAANKEFGTPYKIIRYNNVYGPGQRNHFIPEFIERATGGNYSIYGGSETRSFCYIQDAIDASILVQENPEWNTITNIGNDTETTIIEVASEILHQMGITQPLKLLPSKRGSVKRRLPDISKLRAMGFTPKWTLKEGIGEIINGSKNK